MSTGRSACASSPGSRSNACTGCPAAPGDRGAGCTRPAPAAAGCAPAPGRWPSRPRTSGCLAMPPRSRSSRAELLAPGVGVHPGGHLEREHDVDALLHPVGHDVVRVAVAVDHAQAAAAPFGRLHHAMVAGLQKLAEDLRPDQRAVLAGHVLPPEQRGRSRCRAAGARSAVRTTRPSAPPCRGSWPASRRRRTTGAPCPSSCATGRRSRRRRR